MLTGGRWCRHVDLVVLAVHEALTNADRHGGGVSQVHACVDRGALVITVCDRGPGFEIPPAPVPDDTADDADPLAEDGRGLWLIRQIASRVEADRKDGDFCLRLRFDPP
jgi:anti-sigma regulatory factor (Ser/Thr protein kinase)